MLLYFLIIILSFSSLVSVKCYIRQATVNFRAVRVHTKPAVRLSNLNVHSKSNLMGQTKQTNFVYSAAKRTLKWAKAPWKWLVNSWRRGRLLTATSLLFLAMTFGNCFNVAPIHSQKYPESSVSVVDTRSNFANLRQESIFDTNDEARSTKMLEDRQDNSKFKSLNRMKSAHVQAAENILPSADHAAITEVKKSVKGLLDSLHGAKLDTLIILVVTSVVIPVCKKLNTSPIIGFLLAGTALGPLGLNWVKDVHTIDILGELGIVFFLFEMGLELSLERLKQMRKDVFGLGTSQFIVTAAAGTGVALACGLPPAAAVTIGGSLSLSSSAFVLQLLKDKNEMGTRHGRASFGILLLQDLAVVPLLVVVELLSKGGTGLGKALTIAAIKAVVTVGSLIFVGARVLDPIFYQVARWSNQEAFLSVILSTVLAMSFITQGIGLSNTLGAFLAGLLLSETKYHYQIEADIAPFKGLLLGIFFMTVGFNIDLSLLVFQAPAVLSMLLALIIGKAAIITGLSMLFGLSFASAQHCGLLCSQGGEFAFVAFGIAERAGLLPSELTKLLLTSVALSMVSSQSPIAPYPFSLSTIRAYDFSSALTPLLENLGQRISNNIEQEQGFGHFAGTDKAAEEVKAGNFVNDFVFVCGYGRVGKMVCDMLDSQLIRYVAIDKSPQVAIEARTKGLPVFYGDLSRPEVLKRFSAGEALACVIAIDDLVATNKAVAALKDQFPELPLIVRAKNSQHQMRLEKTYAGVKAYTPALPEDSVLLTLPFGGAVLQKVGVSQPEIEAILEDFRKKYMEGNDHFDGSFDFLTAFRRRLPPPTVEKLEEEEEKGSGPDDEARFFALENSPFPASLIAPVPATGTAATAATAAAPAPAAPAVSESLIASITPVTAPGIFPGNETLRS